MSIPRRMLRKDLYTPSGKRLVSANASYADVKKAFECTGQNLLLPASACVRLLDRCLVRVQKILRRLIDGGENSDHLVYLGQFETVVDHGLDRGDAKSASRTL